MPRGTSRLDEAQLQGRLWTPAADIGSRLALWNDASDLSTISYGTGISAWADKSGKGNTATQATGANQPTLAYNRIVGKPGVLFSTTAQVLTSPIAPSPLTNNFTYFCMVERITMSSNFPTIMGLPGTGTGTGRAIYLSDTTYPICWGQGSDDITGTVIAAIGSRYLVVITKDSSNFVTIRVNGTINASGTPATNPTATGTFAYSSQFLGYIYEAGVLTQSLSVADSQRYEGALAWKWGEVNSLPASHPYKNRPPTIGG